jgi:regulator of replication initiation timing
MSKTMARTVDLEPIDRLEEKVRQLVGMIERFRSDQARLTQENQRLSSELDMAQARLAEAEGTGVELTTLRDEREVIRGRVAEMLEQLDALSL